MNTPDPQPSEPGQEQPPAPEPDHPPPEHSDDGTTEGEEDAA